MFEEMTYETIMRSMMEDMPDDIDTSEGTGTLINGTDDNLQITDKSVPVKGEITCT